MTLTEALKQIEKNFPEAARVIREERDELKDVLRRYVVYNTPGGYELLSKEFGACEHPESSLWMTEWLDRVLLGPAMKVLAARQQDAMEGEE